MSFCSLLFSLSLISTSTRLSLAGNRRVFFSYFPAEAGRVASVSSPKKNRAFFLYIYISVTCSTQTSDTGRGFNSNRQQQLQVHFTAAIRLSISQFFISRAQKEAVVGVVLSEWWLMRDLVDVWVSHTHTSTHLLAKLCSQMYMHIYTNGFLLYKDKFHSSVFYLW